MLLKTLILRHLRRQDAAFQEVYQLQHNNHHHLQLLPAPHAAPSCTTCSSFLHHMQLLPAPPPPAAPSCFVEFMEGTQRSARYASSWLPLTRRFVWRAARESESSGEERSRGTDELRAWSRIHELSTRSPRESCKTGSGRRYGDVILLTFLRLEFRYLSDFSTLWPSEQEVTIFRLRRSEVETCQSPVAPPLKRPLLHGLCDSTDHKVLHDDIMLYRRRLETRDWDMNSCSRLIKRSCDRGGVSS